MQYIKLFCVFCWISELTWISSVTSLNLLCQSLQYYYLHSLEVQIVQNNLTLKINCHDLHDLYDTVIKLIMPYLVLKSSFTSLSSSSFTSCTSASFISASFTASFTSASFTSTSFLTKTLPSSDFSIQNFALLTCSYRNTELCTLTTDWEKRLLSFTLGRLDRITTMIIIRSNDFHGTSCAYSQHRQYCIAQFFGHCQ